MLLYIKNISKIKREQKSGKILSQINKYIFSKFMKYQWDPIKNGKRVWNKVGKHEKLNADKNVN